MRPEPVSAYPLVCVIITTRNEEGNIAGCLESIRMQDYPQEKIEIVVVDNNSDDRTKEIGRKYTNRVFNFGPERSAQRNFGARQAIGDYILYLDADMRLSKGVIAEAVKKCQSEGLCALYIPEKITGKGFWIRVRDFERSFYNATVIDCVRFVRKDKFWEAGGFDEGLTGPEDWDFDRKIRMSGAVGIIDSALTHNEGQFNLRKYLSKKSYYSNWFAKYAQKWGRSDQIVRKQLGLRYRYFGVFIEQGKFKRLFRHPILAMGMYWLRILVGFSSLIAGGRKKLCRQTNKSVLIISPFFRPNIGGVESYLTDLCAYLSKHEYPVYVLTYQPLTNRIKAKVYEKEANLEIRRIAWPGFNLFHKLEPFPVLEFLYLTPGLFIYSLFFMLKNNKKIDVIHAQGLAAAFITKFIARMFRKRSVMSTCAVYNLRPDSLFAKAIKWVLGDFNKILALADVSRRELMSIGVPESKVGVYYLWINQVKYAPRDKQECKKGINLAGRFIVLFVGRFIKIKGVELLVEVAKKIDKGITFVFIGDQGPCFNFIEGAARIYENIKLIKGIRAEQLIPYYQAADIFIIPSLYEEAFGKTIIEALSCGTPVIGSNRGAIPAIITNRVGRVISPSVENIKNEIEYLYRNRAELEKLTRGCRAYAEERFSEKNIEVITNSYY